MKGLGGITIGLPLLEEMVVSGAAAEKAVVPVRAFNVFFGLGIPAPLQKEGFRGVMEPLEPLSKKLLILRGVDQVRVVIGPGQEGLYREALGGRALPSPIEGGAERQESVRNGLEALEPGGDRKSTRMNSSH